MKETPDMRFTFISCFFLSSVILHAQLKQIPIVLQSLPHAKKNQSARVEGSTPITLPFWDDFSFNNSPNNYASDSLWQYGESVWVNTGMGINPPTIKVATFDGIDSTGRPYSVNLPLAKGIADKLTSRPIRMDLVDSTKRDSVFIFFYYQYEGLGEPPDPGDELSLWFKNDSSIWVKVWNDTIRNHDNTKFVPVKFFVKDSSQSYFHDNFQFRFQNFGRLSGPFDTWNLDYVYLSNGESQYLPRRADFPDRAIATPLTSVLKQYHSIPVKHLLASADTAFTYPTITVTNQRSDQTFQQQGPQPVNLVSHLTMSTRRNKVLTSNTILFDTLSAIPVSFGVTSTFKFDSLPRLKGLDPKIDSIGMQFQMQIRSGDNVKKTNDPTNKGDYDTIVYKGIEFRYNDTTTTKFSFSDYYAYDDGVAEYAVTLTQPGTTLAYEFDMMYNQSDTLVAVDLYFPHVGDESNQVVLFKIWYDLSQPQLDSMQLTIQRTENNKFIRVPLTNGLLVKDKFYVGWKQNSTAAIGVGFDKNSSSSSKIFYQTASLWLQDSTLKGNLMIRPVFGNAATSGPITAVEEKSLLSYPNPNHGVFYVPQPCQNLQVVDVTGRSITFIQEENFQTTQVTLSNPGIYLVRYFDGSKWRTDKIMVLP